MLSMTEKTQYSMCVICDTHSNSILCQICKSETREDFYLLLLTKIKDECENYENLKTKCIDLQDVINVFTVPDQPTVVFNENLHSIDNQTKKLIDNYTDLISRDAIPVEVVGDGNCMFHTIHTFYPMMNIDEIRCRCLIELCTHEQHYDTVRITNGFDLVDDECVQDHVMRVLNNNQYTGVLTLAALTNVLDRPIESIYPKVNHVDAYFDVLNTTFFPREQNFHSKTPIRIFWSGPDNDLDHDWRANHFVPVMTSSKLNIPYASTVATKNTSDDTLTAENTCTTPTRTLSRSTTSKMLIEKEKTTIDEENDENISSYNNIGTRRTFLEAPLIIEQVLNAVKEKSCVTEPPKMVISSSIFIVKYTEENRSSISKDGNGTWVQDSSRNTHFVLTTNNNYQIVRKDLADRFYYNTRVEGQYVAHYVDEDSIITLRRMYATNKADSSFRRMICYLTRALDDSAFEQLPIFLQYIKPTQVSEQKFTLRPHGNSTKSNVSFTSTLPSVLEKIKSYSKSTKPSTIYTNSSIDIIQSSNPTLSIIRNKTQIYNARNTHNGTIEEYMAVMKRLENQNSIVARFSMTRYEAPIIILSQNHLIQEIKRCCMNASSQTTSSVLGIDTTFNLGKFFVTTTTFRNQALQNRKTKKSVITLGPTMIHYREDSHSYQELLEFIRGELKEFVPKALGSDGAKPILNAISTVFPSSVHLFCTRHVRQNIERHLIKSRVTIDQRHTLLEFIFDSSESLIQSKTNEEFERRLDTLREISDDIRNEDNSTEDPSRSFFEWFERYQVNNFRYHLLASVRSSINYVDTNGNPRLYYNNDVEAMNHVLKIATNWEIKSLSDVIDIVDRAIATQRSELIRSLYDAGDWELVAPYTRFLHDPRIWSLKTIQERNAVLDNYYSFIPRSQVTTTAFNVPRRAGKKPGQRRARTTSTKTRKNK